MATMSKQEMDWQAEDDARALMRAKVIMADAARMKAATAAAARIMKERKAEMEAMEAVAAGKA